MRKLVEVCLLGCLLVGGLALAQGPSEPKYGYDVSSVKKADPAARGTRIMPGPQGGLRTSNTSLMTLMTFAYDVRDYQIYEAPGWVKTDAFDVSFTPDKPETMPKPGEQTDIKTMDSVMERQRQRMQAVLRDRFGLKLRQETREMPMYALTVSKTGIKLGEPTASKGPSMMMNDKGDVTGYAVDMRLFTNILSNILRKPVVDETGREGTFDLKLHFKPDNFIGGPGGPPPGEAPPAEIEGPSIFTAVTEQLGLKLESKKGPVLVYVVEKVSKPEEN